MPKLYLLTFYGETRCEQNGKQGNGQENFLKICEKLAERNVEAKGMLK